MPSSSGQAQRAGTNAPTIAGTDAPAIAGAEGRPVGLEVLEAVHGDGTVDDPDKLATSARRSGLSEEQVAALLDGDVTFAEHEALMHLTVKCLRDHGVRALEPSLVTDSITSFQRIGYAVPAEVEGLSAEEIRSIDAMCFTKHGFAAQELYAKQHGPSVAEVEELTKEAFSQYRSCLVERGGLDLPPLEDLTYGELLSFVDTVPDCAPP